MGQIDIKKLNIDELIGVVNLYPWFSCARRELCDRMSRMGDAWGEAQFADAALYLADRDMLADMLRKSFENDWSDTDVEKLLKSYISENDKVDSAAEAKPRTVHVVGGDYFSQEDYEQVRLSDDNVFSRYAAKAMKDAPAVAENAFHEVSFYTETLAQIYAEQGYYDQSKEIYSKLILAYPEKSAYFASLIQKIDKINS